MFFQKVVLEVLVMFLEKKYLAASQILHQNQILDLIRGSGKMNNIKCKINCTSIFL